MPQLHKYVSACMFIRLKTVYIHQKLRHLVSWCLDSACFIMLRFVLQFNMPQYTCSNSFKVMCTQDSYHESKTRCCRYNLCCIIILIISSFIFLAQSWVFHFITWNRFTLSDWTFFMFWILLGIWRLSNALTESLAWRRGDMQLDCVCCSCVFGLDRQNSPFLPSPCPVLQYLFMVLFFNSSVLSTVILHFLQAYSSSFLPSISLPISFFPLLSSPLLLSAWQSAVGPLLLAASQSVT